METLDIAPTAAALLKSLRGLGYTPETALADLIDNSIRSPSGSTGKRLRLSSFDLLQRSTMVAATAPFPQELPMLVTTMTSGGEVAVMPAANAAPFRIDLRADVRRAENLRCDRFRITMDLASIVFGERHDSTRKEKPGRVDGG